MRFVRKDESDPSHHDRKVILRLLMDRVAGKLPEQSVMRAIKPRLVVLDERFAGTQIAESAGEVWSQ